MQGRRQGGGGREGEREGEREREAGREGGARAKLVTNNYNVHKHCLLSAPFPAYNVHVVVTV